MMLPLVIGVGRPHCGDDSAGLEVARRLRIRAAETVAVVLADGEASSLMQAWAGQERVVIIDASASGSRPGTVRRFDAVREPLPSRHRAKSTHGFGVVEAIEMARALDSLPKSLVVYGIEGRSFDIGSDLSPEVVAVVDEVVARALEECEVEA